MVDQIFSIVILIMSVVIHEVAHGYTAYRLGDNTARIAGRLTLNPLKHLDLFGSVILPGLLVLMNTNFIIGWAKPVPYNPRNLRNGKRGDFLVSISGIMANILLAVIFGLLIRYGYLFGLSANNNLSSGPLYTMFGTIVLINLILALFNLIPIPPLDGSKVLFSFLPARWINIQRFLEQYSLYILIFFIFFVWDKVFPVIFLVFSLLTGIS
jgi:Zn-dependent protease